MNSFLMMFSIRDLIIVGIILAIIILAVVISFIISSKTSKKKITIANEEADFYCNLYYFRQLKEAELKYKAYISRGYHDKLPNQVEAIKKDKQMQELLDEAGALIKRKAILEEYLPSIMLALVRCREEGLEAIPKKEALQLKKLMKVYGVSEYQQMKGK